ncbi:Os05g0116850, partial [Oryza sativa Japonica Group]
GIDATVAGEGRHEEHGALHRQVRRREVERPAAAAAAAEVELVEVDAQPAVHLDVRAQHRLRLVGGGGEPLGLDGAGRREVDERAEVGVVGARHGAADQLGGVLHGAGRQLAGGAPRERPEDEVAEVAARDGRPHARPAVHGDAERRGLAGGEAARQRWPTTLSNVLYPRRDGDGDDDARALTPATNSLVKWTLILSCATVASSSSSSSTATAPASWFFFFFLGA